MALRTSPGSLRGVLLTAAATGTLLTGCGGARDDAGPRERVRVVAAFYPLAEAASQIGGDRVAVSDLTPLGGQPHDLPLTPDASRDLARARVVLYLGDGFQPQIAKAAAALPAPAQALDLLAGAPLVAPPSTIPGTRGPVEGGGAPGAALDPHLWVDPVRFAAMAQQVQAALVAADPAGRSGYERRGAAYLAGLRALDGAFRAGLSECRSTVLITTHPAFGYLASEYGLRQAVAAGISPASVPSPRSLAALRRYAARQRASTIYLTAPAPARLARSLERGAGLSADALDAVENPTADARKAGATYASIMRDNLGRLERGLRCRAAPATSPTTPGT